MGPTSKVQFDLVEGTRSNIKQITEDSMRYRSPSPIGLRLECLGRPCAGGYADTEFLMSLSKFV